MKKYIVLLSVFTLVISCNSNKQKQAVLPSVTGEANNIVIVIDNEDWNQATGDVFRNVFMQATPGLSQPEPLFKLINVPSSAFNNIFKLHRNILYVDVNNKKYKQTKVLINKDRWAKHQYMLTMMAPDTLSLNNYLRDNEGKIMAQFADAERERIIYNYKRTEERMIRAKLEKNHQLSLVVPKGYILNVDSSDFVWISHQGPDLDQGILIYDYPYTDADNFKKEYLLQKRDVILKKYVPGPVEGSYMTTEYRFPITFQQYYNKQGQYIAQLKGLWRVENDFMGGPFISHTTVDTLRNRIVTVEGYIFAPNQDKRNYMCQLDAILNTLEIK